MLRRLWFRGVFASLDLAASSAVSACGEARSGVGKAQRETRLDEAERKHWRSLAKRSSDISERCGLASETGQARRRPRCPLGQLPASHRPSETMDYVGPPS